MGSNLIGHGLPTGPYAASLFFRRASQTDPRASHTTGVPEISKLAPPTEKRAKMEGGQSINYESISGIRLSINVPRVCNWA